MSESTLDEWDLWYPQAASTGLPFARGRIDPVDVLLVHAAPPSLTVTVRQSDRVRAEGKDLPSTADTPMARLTCREGRVTREDIWPGPEDLGRPVLLPGGEAGLLRSWWNADDHSEWRWVIELYNHR